MDLLELENNPKFAELSYGEQVSLRSEWFNETFGRNRQFLELPDQEKAKLMQETLFRPPVLEDKGLQQQIGQVGARALAGDEEAQKFIQREVNVGAFQNQSMIAKLFDKGVISGPSERAQKASGNDPFGHGDIVMSKDQASILGYFDMILSQDEQAAKRQKVVKPLLSIAGAVTDFALIYALTGGSAIGAKAMAQGGRGALSGAPKLLGKLAVKPGQAIWAKATSTAGRHMGQLMASTGHAMTTATLGTGREFAKAWLNDEDMPVERKALLEKAARWYGGYFLGDIVANIFTDYALPVLKTTGKAYTGSTMAERMYLAFSKADADEMLALTIAGKAIPKRLLQTMPESLQESIIAKGKAITTIQNTPVASADELTEVVASAYGFTLKKLDEGWEVGEAAAKGAEGAAPKGMWFSVVPDENGVPVVTRHTSVADARTRAGVEAPTKGKAVVTRQGEWFSITDPYGRPMIQSHATEREAMEALKKEGIFNFKDKRPWSNVEKEYVAFSDRLAIVMKGEKLLAKRGFDPATIDVAPKAGARNVKQKGSVFLGETNLHKHGFQTPEELEAATLRKTGGSGKARYVVVTPYGITPPKGVPRRKALGSMEEVRDYIQDVLRLRDANALSQYKAGVEAGARGQVQVRRFVTGIIPDLDKVTNEYLAHMAAPVMGTFDPENLQAFIQVLMRRQGMSEKIINSVGICGTQGVVDKMTVKAVGRQLVIKGKNLSPHEEVREIKKIVDWVQGKTKLKAKRLPEGDLAGFSDSVHKEFLELYKNSTGRDILPTPAFVADLADKRLGLKVARKKGKWYLGEEVYDDFEDLGNAVLRRVADPDHVHRYVYKEYGLGVMTDEKTGAVTVRRDKAAIETAPSMDELLIRHPEYTPRLSSECAPVFSVVKEGIEMTYVDRVIAGNLGDVKAFMAKFDDYEPLEQIVTLSGKGKNKLILNPATNTLEVTIPDVAYRATFGDVDEARAFLRGWTESANMQKIALSKGYRYTTMDGKYILYSGDGGRYAFETLESMTAKLKEIPQPSYIKELTGVDDKLVSQFVSKDTELVDIYKPETYNLDVETGMGRRMARRQKRYRKAMGDEKAQMPTGVDADYSIGTMVGYWTLPPRQYFEKIVADGGSALPLQWYDTLEKSLQLARGQAANYYSTIDRLFRTADGKSMGYHKRLGIRDLLEETDPVERAKTIKQYGLTDADLVVEEQLRKGFGRDPESGFALAFDVDPQDFLQNYFPRIRRSFLDKDMKMRLARAPDTEHALKILYKDNVPPLVYAFFKKARKNDVLKFAAVEDPLEAMHMYVKSGLKDRFVTPVVEDALGAVKEKTVGTMAFHQFNRYVTEIGNFPVGLSEKGMREATPRLLTKLGLDPGLSQDISKLIMSGGYLSLMGFRPWLPLRNMMQIYTMLAPRVGNEWVSYGTKMVAADADGKIFTRLRELGIKTTSGNSLSTIGPVPSPEQLSTTRIR